MFEIKFNDENIDIEQSIEDSKKKINKPKSYIINMLINFLLTGIATFAFTFAWPFNNNVLNIIKTISTAICGIGIYNFLVYSYDLFKNQKNKQLKEEAKFVLDGVSEALKKNNVNTNSRELSNSIIIENSVVSFEEKNEDGIVNYSENDVNDKYYLFLDKNYKVSGLLEKNTETINNNITTSERRFYVLENEDIEGLDHKVIKTKKLVRRPNIDKKYLEQK